MSAADPSSSKDEYPRPLEALLGAQQISLRSIINAKLAVSVPNLLIRPAVGQFRVLDFRRMTEILAASSEAKECTLRGLSALVQASAGTVAA